MHFFDKYKSAAWAGTLAGASLLGGCDSAENLAHLTPAEQISRQVDRAAVASFDGALPGMASVNEYPILDAKFTLVHIRQIHAGPMGTMPVGLRYSLRCCQEQILEALYAIEGERHIDALYPEGVSVETLDEYNHKLYQQRMRMSQGGQDLLKRYDIDILNAAAPIELQGKGASALFCIQTGARFNASSTIRAEKKLAAALASGHDDHPAVLGKREQLVLKRIVEDFPEGCATAVTVYGADHDFRDDVAQWNEAHPQQKFSLVVATPQAVLDLHKRAD